jgi:hypothetical protein
MEQRRAQLRGEPIKVRRKAYSAVLLLDELDLILKIAKSVGAPWESLTDIGAINARRLIRETPTYHVERELALRIEAQDRALSENDFRDMSSFCAAIPYADIIIGEKQFSSLVCQAGLDKHYNTIISANLEALYGKL